MGTSSCGWCLQVERQASTWGRMRGCILAVYPRLETTCVHSDAIRWVPPVFNLTSAFWSSCWMSFYVSSGQRWFWRDSLAVWKTLKFPERRTICWAAQTTQDWPKAAPLRYSNTAPSCLYCLSSLKATFAQFKYFSTSTLSFKGKSEEN